MGVKTKLGMVAGLAAAAAGAYYLYYSKHAKKNRAAVKGWMEKAEKEIMTEVRKLKDVALDENTYKNIVKTVATKYKKLKKLEESEVEDFVDALQSAWKDVKENVASGRKKVGKIIAGK